MWLLKLLALIFLACVILEPKFRRFVFRLGRNHNSQPKAESPKEGKDTAVRDRGEDADVRAALSYLGYSARESSQAIASLPQDRNLSLEEKVNLALRYFGGSR
jgi:Holliday junction resolvasome RuvABC DNA-binding subunit